MLKIIIILLIILFFIGCADKHQLTRLDNITEKLDSNKNIFISIPEDGRYGNINYNGSGQNTSQIIFMSLSKYSNNVEKDRYYESLKDALVYSYEKGFEYLFFPVILEWEDRATEWSGLPDKVAIKIRVIDVKTNKTLDSVIIKGQSGLATFGGDHPQDLLNKPIDEYIHSLF
jgi:hypothetical protein